MSSPYVLIVDDDQQVLELLRILLEGISTAVIKTAGSVSEAKEILLQDSKASLIISDHDMPDETGNVLEAFVIDKGWNIPFVVCSGRPRAEIIQGYKQILDFVQKPDVIDPLEKIVHLLSLNLGGQSEEREFVAVRVSTLVHMGIVKIELFLRLSKEKFVKISHSNDYLEPADARRFLEKKISHLYIRASDASRISRVVLAHYFSLEAQSELDLSEAFCATNASVEAVQFLFHAFGWTPEVEDLVKRGTSLAIKALRSSPSILEMIKRHRENCGAYVSAHSNILIYLCCGISCTLEWHSDFTSAKLCMAALLHDLTLDVEEIENAEQLNKMALEKVSSPAVEIYKTHPAKSAALLSGIKNLPPDIDKIILQHHERPDGKGFPSNLNHSRFTPLGALFVIAEDLVVELGKRPDQEIPAVIQEFITSRSEYYGQGYFKKVLSSLAHSLKVPS